ncbi:MAG: sigma-54-dependent Fis family transcriptional regulator [candidate division Zixibacteria bacterium]|nr:sigma-54-dependent Fis family transcriptional regulator [candidate division Zixibacteria bacterium]
MAHKILIVDDEPNILKSFSSLLNDEGFETCTAGSAEAAAAFLADRETDLVLLDLQMPGQSGLDFLRTLKDEIAPPLVLVISGQADIPMALEAMKLGAVNFLEKPVPPEKLLAGVRSSMLLADANRQRFLLVDDLDDRHHLVGKSKAIKKLLQTVNQVAPTDTTVLISGANGTGKELVATRLFLNSRRRDKPFIRVNCPGIPESLFESELFGHIKGAFTGAVRDYPGRFFLADGGTIFLDEIGDLPLNCQAKLLRVLETGEVETLGADRVKTVDVRLICATNRDMPRLMAEGRFRQDLFYRISVFLIEVPPLSERPDDIPLLVGEFLKRFDPSGKTRLSPDSLAYLSGLDYPGNVRQLKNIIERLTILYRDRIIEPCDILTRTGWDKTPEESPEESRSLPEKVSWYEKQLIEKTLADCGGNISETARKLKVDRANLSRKIKELGIKNK